MISLPLALLLSLDSFVVCIALGTFVSGRATRRRLVLAFGGCDALATLAGAAHGPLATIGWMGNAGPALLGVYGIAVLLAGWWGRAVAGDRRVLFALPVLLSLDNLVVGAGSTAGIATALWSAMAGLASGTMALAGLMLGEALTRRLRIPAWTLAGTSLLAAAAVLVLA
jgi:putative Mn2+ efflux pump MntP